MQINLISEAISRFFHIYCFSDSLSFKYTDKHIEDIAKQFPEKPQAQMKTGNTR